MDAVEYLKARHRLCVYHTRNNDTCEGCPLGSTLGTCYPHQIERANPEEAVNNVDSWAKEHPAPTRQSVFMERYPNTFLDIHGFVNICPCIIEGKTCSKTRGNLSFDCDVCRKQYWSQEAVGSE